MRNRVASVAAGALGLALCARGSADDLKAQDRFLCTALQASVCTTDAECTDDAPWNLNIPQFIEIDVKNKTVSTTKASGENRSTPVRSVDRADGLIVLQGFEAGRAFSFVISEETGIASVAVARDSKVVSIFGACTPMPAAAK